MITLILKECLAYLFILVNVAPMRVELTIVRCVTVCLNVICISGYASIDGSGLTCCSVRVNLFFVKHLHFLLIITAIALRWRSVILTILCELTILLMA